jgi:hypothetical protein
MLETMKADTAEWHKGNLNHTEAHSLLRRLRGVIDAIGRELEADMNIDLHAPTMPIFLVSLVLAVLALLGHFVVIPYITLYGFWIAIIAYGVLAVGTVMKT